MVSMSMSIRRKSYHLTQNKTTTTTTAATTATTATTTTTTTATTTNNNNNDLEPAARLAVEYTYWGA